MLISVRRLYMRSRILHLIDISIVLHQHTIRGDLRTTIP